MKFFSKHPPLKAVLFPGYQTQNPLTGMPGANIPMKVAQFKNKEFRTDDPEFAKLMLKKLLEVKARGLTETFCPVIDGPESKAEYDAIMAEIEAEENQPRRPLLGSIQHGDAGDKNAQLDAALEAIGQLTDEVSQLRGTVEILSKDKAKPKGKGKGAEPQS